MPTEISGSTGVNKIQDNTIVNADINSSAAIAGSKLVMPTGSVLQVVQGLNTNTLEGGFLLNTTSSSYVAVPLSATITPSATSSKILILLTTCFYRAGSSSFTIYGGGSNIGDSTHGIQRMTGADANWRGESHSILHSPSTTSAITYQLYVRIESGGDLTVGGDGGVRNTITLMEIAG